jgi:hypothetical protein
VFEGGGVVVEGRGGEIENWGCKVEGVRRNKRAEG